MSGDASGFTYTKTDAQGTTSAWSDAPAATYDGGTVTWDLSSVGQLENGVTYTVSFRVWPSQDAYDLVAQLNNGSRSYDDLTADQRAQIVRQSGGYALKTNVAGSAQVGYTYLLTRTDSLKPAGTENADGTITGDDGYVYAYDSADKKWVGTKRDTSSAGIADPDPIMLASRTVQLQKQWDNSIDSAAEESVGIDVIADGDTVNAFYSTTLTPDSGWTAQIHLAPGLMTVDDSGNVTVLNGGHAYTAQEASGDGLWDFAADTVRPMIVNGSLVMLSASTDGPSDLAENASTTLDGVTYYNLGGTIYEQGEGAYLMATNTRRSSLTITKSVTAGMFLTPSADAEFGFRATVNSGDGSDVTFSVRDASGGVVTPSSVKVDGTAVTSDSGTYTAASGAEIDVSLKAGQSLTFDSLPVGSTYEAYEYDEGAGFTLSQITATKGNNDGVVETFPVSVSGKDTKASGTIDADNMRYALDFTNDYSVAPTAESTLFTGTKVLANRDFQEGDSFEFRVGATYVDPNGVQIDAVTVPLPSGVTRLTGDESNAGTITVSPTSGRSTDIGLGTLSFSLPGTYTYEVVELVPNASAAGMSYSGAHYIVSVKVVDDGNGSLRVDSTSTRRDLDDNAQSVSEDAQNVPDNALTFTNTYSADNVEVTLRGIKSYSDKSGAMPLTDGMFSFQLTADTEGAPMPSGTVDGTYTSTNDDYTIALGTIKLGQSDVGKTYTYTAKEAVPASGNAGMTYDTVSHTIEVAVTQTSSGAIKTQVSYDGSTSALGVTFSNTFDPGTVTLSGDTALGGTKTLTGRDMLDGETFDFTLIPDETTRQAVEHGDVTIADGATTASVSGATNGEAKSFSFGDVTFSHVGTFTFTIAEAGRNGDALTSEANAGAGITYDEHACTVTVEVTLDADSGKLVASVDYGTNGDAAGNAFANAYRVSEAIFDGSGVGGTKTLTGRDSLGGETFGFTLKLTSDNAGDVSGLDADNAASAFVSGLKNGVPANFDFSGFVLTFKAAGTYEFSLSETSWNGTSLDGVTDPQGLAFDTHACTVTIKVTEDKSTGTLTVAAPEYSTDPATDAAETANAFTNAYSASTTVDVDGAADFAKTLDGRAWQDGDEFTFEMTPENNAPSPTNPTVTLSGALAAEGQPVDIDFGDITFAGAGTYAYTVRETSTDAQPGVTLSQAEYRVVYTVTDNLDGTLSATPEVTLVTGNDGAQAGIPVTAGGPAYIVNSYSATDATVSLRAYKDYTNASGDPRFDLADGSFSVTLRPTGDNADAAPMPDGFSGEGADRFYTARNVEEVFSMPDLVFTQHDEGTYTYTLSEDGASGNGMTYDANVYTITVTVSTSTDEAAGSATMVAETTVKDAEGNEVDLSRMTFTNVYNPEDVTLSGDTALSGTKTLTGRDMLDDETFDFTLTPDETTQKAVDSGYVTIADGATTASVSGAKDGDAAPFSFGALTFSRVGTYTFNMSEVAGGAGGVTYDAHACTVTVEVTLDADSGKLVASVDYGTNGDAAGNAFANAYSATDATVSLRAYKDYTNASGDPRFDLADGSFSVTLRPTGDNADAAPMPDGATGEGADRFYTARNVGTTFSIPEISFTQYDEGTYTYTLSEDGASGNGMTYDSNVYTITIKVSTSTDAADGTAKMMAETAIRDASGAEVALDGMRFTNVYDPEDVTLSGDTALQVQKTLTGRDSLEGESFSFTLAQTAGPDGGVSGLDGNGQTSVSVNGPIANGSSATAGFGALTFSKVGTYAFDVSEVAGGAGGVTYDGHVSTVTVVVTDLNADNVVDGHLYATVSYDNAAATTESDRGVTSAAAFTNVYKANPAVIPSSGEGSLSVTKTLEVPEGLTGPESVQGAFTFTVAPAADYGDAVVMPESTTVSNPDAHGGTATFDSITFNEAGAYEFTITESGSVAGVTNDAESVKHVTVNVVDDQNGKLVATVYGADTTYKADGTIDRATTATTFTNTYSAASVDVSLTASKVLNNSVMRGGEFDFKISGGEGSPMPESDSATNTADGVVSFGSIRFTEPGTYTYSISEVADPADEGVFEYDTAARTVTVVVVDDAAGKLAATVYGADGSAVSDGASCATFTNTYVATSDEAVISAIKNVNGEASGSDETFQFTISAKDGGALPAQTTVTNNGGSVTFGPITYSADIFAGDTADGSASSVADASASSAVDASLTADESMTIAADDAASAAGDDSGATTGGSAANGSDEGLTNSATDAGSAENVAGDQAPDEGSEQQATDEPGTTAETPATKTAEATETTEVTEAAVPEAAEAAVPEAADAASVVSALFAVPEANAAELGDQQAAGTTPAIVHNPDGTRQITYTYVISEVAGGAAGYGYDAAQYEAYVTVTDDLAGNITTSVAYGTSDGNAPTFENTYSASGSATVTAHKVVDGQTTLGGGEFTFELRENGQTVATATNAADGTVTFDVQYLVSSADSSSLGAHRYSIVETGGNVNEANWTFDSAERFATVNVTDNGDGTLSTSVSYDDGAEPTFTNSYRPLPVNLTITAHKVLTGRDLTAGEFTFQLLDADKSVVSQATNDADGNVTFDRIGYVETGEHTYYIAEVAGTDSNVTYDAAVKQVTVKVTDEGGQLVATAQGDGDDATFTNVYEKPAEPVNPGKSDEGDKPEQSAKTDVPEPTKPADPGTTATPTQPTKGSDIPKTGDATDSGAAMALGAAGAAVALIGGGVLLRRRSSRRG
ncbi:MAG: FctA domain-containing protein [Coriobacteriales bacterium]